MSEFNFTMGVILLILNSTILISSLVNIIYRFKAVKTITTVKDLDINYMLLFTSLVFLFANSFAFYSGYKYYIKDGNTIAQDIIVLRLVDRVSMLVVSIILLLTGKNISKNITEKR